MARRALGHLKNLGKWATGTTKKTTEEKSKKDTVNSKKINKGKENAPPNELWKSTRHAVHERNDPPDITDMRGELEHGDGSETRQYPLNDLTRLADNHTRQSVSIGPMDNLEFPNHNDLEMDILQNEFHQQCFELGGQVYTDPNECDNQGRGAEEAIRDAGSINSTSGSSESDSDGENPSGCADPRLAGRFQPAKGSAGKAWEERKPPTEIQALEALDEIDGLLRPRYDGAKQKRYKESKCKSWGKRVLQEIKVFLNIFSKDKSPSKGRWIEASDQAATALGKPTKYAARRLRDDARKFISLKKEPASPYGTWTRAKIDEDEEFAQEINLFLQSQGKYVKSSDIAVYLNKPEVQEKWSLKKSIGRATCKRWMHRLKYRWVKNHKGLYVDGHERPDVVKYRQEVYLPSWYKFYSRMRSWDKDGNEEPLNLPPGTKPLVGWFHDESIYYAHDRRESQWVHESASPAPYAKGEGVSLMDAEFMSPDYGFCCSPDRQETARIIFKPGKNRDGYFDNDDILAQATKAMDICEKYYPNDEHIFIYDNAPTHLKRAEDALSARKMPKFTPKEGSNWGIEVNKRGSDGKIEYGPNGKPLRIKIKMGNGYFCHGGPQEFYFPEGHPRAGVFKGMAVILQERGYTWASDLRAECPKFKCPPGSTRCCCRRILYNEPDFVNVKSLLQEHCERRGFLVLFLPKFHCELNPIEMVWGRSKYHYRMYPTSSTEADLESNMLKALGTVSIDEMRRYSRRSRRFTDAYFHGLDGKEAAWANKKYRGHRMMPECLMKDMEEAGLREKSA